MTHDLFSLPEWDPTPARKPDTGAVRPGASSPATTTEPVSPVRRDAEQQPRKAGARSFFNTPHLSGPELARARRDAMTQQDRIARLFEQMPDDWTATPSKVHQLVGGSSPITSIRRAITNLTDEGVLVRTCVQKMGPFGKPEYTWRRAISVRRAA